MKTECQRATDMKALFGNAVCNHAFTTRLVTWQVLIFINDFDLCDFKTRGAPCSLFRVLFRGFRGSFCSLRIFIFCSSSNFQQFMPQITSLIIAF